MIKEIIDKILKDGYRHVELDFEHGDCFFHSLKTAADGDGSCEEVLLDMDRASDGLVYNTVVDLRDVGLDSLEAIYDYIIG